MWKTILFFLILFFKVKTQTVKGKGSNKLGHETLSMDLTDSWCVCQMLRISAL